MSHLKSKLVTGKLKQYSKLIAHMPFLFYAAKSWSMSESKREDVIKVSHSSNSIQSTYNHMRASI